MTLRKFAAIVAVLSLCLPTLTSAAGGAAHRQMAQADVRRVQERLQALGLYQGPVDGTYGPQTAEALVAYQRTRGLEVTGTLTPETRQALLAPSETGETAAMAEPAETATTALAGGAVGAAAGATLGAIAGSAAVGAAIGGPIGLAAGALGATLWSLFRA